MKEKRKFDSFDEYASGYRSIHNENIKLTGSDSFYFAEMKVVLLKAYEINKPLSVLDIGCGDGTTEKFFNKHFPLWNVTGIDVSKESIRAAAGLKLQNAEFFHFDGMNIPEKLVLFDLVFIAGVLHHVAFNFHNQLMQEVYRVLAPGGRLYLYEHNPINPFTQYLVKTCVFDKKARLLPHFYTKKLIEKSGFSEIRKKFIVFFPRHKIFTFLHTFESLLSRIPLGAQYFIRATKGFK